MCCWYCAAEPLLFNILVMSMARDAMGEYLGNGAGDLRVVLLGRSGK